jgi:hypothetical protein
MKFTYILLALLLIIALVTGRRSFKKRTRGSCQQKSSEAQCQGKNDRGESCEWCGDTCEVRGFC